MSRLKPQRRPIFPDRPFAGQGVSIYATSGERVQYRHLRCIGRRIVQRGGGFPLGAAAVSKTARRASQAGMAAQTLEVELVLPAAFASQSVAFDVRHYRDDVENEGDNYNVHHVELDSALDPADEIRGTAELLSSEARAGGIVRLRFRWIAASDGIDPVQFRWSRTAGPTSPADVVVTYEAGISIYEADTPALSDASAYTYKLTAENGAVTRDLLTGVSVTADATGPPAVSGVRTEAR